MAGDDANFYCSVFPDTLVTLQKASGAECAIDAVMSCLRSFNLEGVDVQNQEEIENLNVII